MLSFRNRGLALGAWLTLAAVLPAQGLPKAEEVLDKYIMATGGKEAHLKIKNQVSHGKMDIGGSGIKGTVVVHHAEPAKMLVQVDLEGIGKIEQGTDGKVVWEKNPLTGTRVLSGPEKAAFLRRAMLHGDVEWRKVYKKVETTGEDKVDGKAAYKVQLTPEDGEVATQYYDKESGLLLKVTVTAKTAMGDFPTESMVSDYRKVDGVLVPHKVKQVIAMLQELTITIDKIESNTKIPDEKFAIPADVKPLLDKK